MSGSDPTSKLFKVELKSEIPYHLAIWPGGFLLGILIKPATFSTWPVMLILLLFFVIHASLEFRLTSIEINTAKSIAILTKYNVLRSKRMKIYPMNELQFSYKREVPGFRRSVTNICRVFINDREIAAIIPDNDGWTEDTVNALAGGLLKAGVPRKSAGYSNRDAEIKGL